MKLRRTLLPIICLAALLLPAAVRGQGFQNHLHVQSCTQGRNWTAEDLVRNILLGQGIQVSNVRFNGSANVIGCSAIGTFFTDSNAATTEIGLREGILITTGSITGAPGPNSSERITTPYSCPSYSDSSLQRLAGNTYQLYHTSVLEFDFTPQTDSVGFRYVFASDEYPEYIRSAYNDIFAFFVTGPNPLGGDYNDTNIAIIPGTNLPVSIHNINPITNSQLYVDNFGGSWGDPALWDTTQIEYDGFTTVLTAYVHVVPCSLYHMRISLSDVNDSSLDCGVFLEAGSLSAKSVEVTLREPDSSETTSHYINETCCLDMIVKRLKARPEGDTLCLYRSNLETSDEDYTIEYFGSVRNVSTNPNAPTYLPFPEGQDSIVIRICGTPDENRDYYERFQLFYKLKSDCNFLVDTFTIVNVNSLALRTPQPGESGDIVTINAIVSGGVGPYTYTWEDMLTHSTQTTTSTGSSSIDVSLEPLRQYLVCVTDACGNTTCIYCAVGPTPIFIDTTTVYDTICYESRDTLTSTCLTCSNRTTYFWYQGNDASGLVRGTNSSFITQELTRAGDFTLLAIDTIYGVPWRNVRHYHIALEALPTVNLYDDDHNRSVGDPGDLTTYACNGERVHLRVGHSTTSTVRWGSSGPFGDPDTHSVWPTQPTTTGSSPATTVNVWVQGPSPRHCLSQRTFTIYIYKRPELTPVADIERCTTQTFTLQANPLSQSGVRHWYTIPSTGYTSGVISAGGNARWQNLTSPNSRAYIIHAATGGNNITCEATDTVQVTIHPLPTLTTTATPQQACSGEPVTLTGGGANTYVWKRNGTTIASTASTTVTNSNTSATSASNVTYQLQGTDIHGCQNTKNITVSIHSVPTVNLTATPTPICVNGTVALRATGARNLSWDSNSWSNTTTLTRNQVMGTTGSNTLYAWGYNTLQRCNNRAQAVVNVLAYPVVTLTRDADSVCAGQSTIIRASGAYEYSLGDTLHFTTTPTFTVTPTGTGTTYTVYGRNSSHMCISSATIRVGVIPLPNVTLNASANPICNGQSTTLTATGGHTYNWAAGSTSLAEHGSSLTVSPTATTTYTVTAITHGYASCSASQNVAITVYNYPGLTAMPDTSICTGRSIVLRGTPATASGVTYWYTLGSSTYGRGSSAQWTVTPAAAADYVLHASRGPNDLCQVADTVHISLYALPTVTANANPQQACSGESVTLTGGGASTYVWKRGSSTIATSATTTVTNTNSNATTASTVTYQVTGTDNHGCANSTNVTVSVHSVPTVNVSANPSPICVGDQTTLTATGARNYSWDSTAWSSTLNSRLLTLNSPGPSTHYAWGYNTLERCNNRGQVVVNVLAYPVVTLTRDADSVCAGESTIIRASGAYEYSLGDMLHFSTTSTFTVTPTGTGTTYTVYGRNSQHMCISSATIRVGVLPLPAATLSASDTHICNGQSTLLTATGGSSYNWFAGTTQLAEHGPTLTVSPSATTTYTVTAITTAYTSCSNNKSLQIQVHDHPVLAAMPDTAICTGLSMVLRATPATASAVTYWYTFGGTEYGRGTQARWTVTPPADTSYIIHASRGPNDLCHVSDTVHVSLYPLPVVTTTSTPQQACSGESVTLAASGANTYVWSRNGNTIAATTSTQVTNTNTSATTPTNIVYQAVGTDIHGCIGAPSTVTVTVHSVPTTQLSAYPTLLCVDDQTTLTASGATHLSWDSTQWDQVSTINSQLTTLNTLTTPGIHTFPVWGYNTLERCNHRSNVSVEALPYPNVVVTTDADSVCPGYSTTLHFSGAYEYSLGDTLHFSTDTTHTVTPTGDGTTYTVYGRNSHHMCISSTTIRVGVLPLPRLSLSVSDSIICHGDTIHLVSTGGVTRNWTANNVLLDNHDTLLTVAPDVTTHYHVEAFTNGYMICSLVADIDVTVYDYPVFSAMADTGVCAGDAVNLYATPQSAAGTTFWYTKIGGNGSAQGLGNNAYWTFVPADSSDYVIHASTGPNYLCQVADTVHVNRFPLPVLTTQAVPPIICSGDSATLIATGAQQYTWAYSGTPLAPQQGGRAVVTLTNDYVDSSVVTYTLAAIDSNQCHNNAQQSVTVHSIPTISLHVPATEYCVDDILQRTATGARYFSWDSTNWTGPYTSAYNSSITLSTTGPDTLHLWGSNSRYACNSHVSQPIQVYSYPVVQITPSADTICFGDSVTLTLSGAAQYSINGSAFTTVTTHTFTLNATTTYIVRGRLSNGMCEAADTITIHVLDLPTIGVTASASIICQGDSITLTASNSGTGGASGFLWYNAATGTLLDNDSSATHRVSPDTTTTYRVIGITEGNVRCRNMGETLVTVFQRPTLTVMDDTAICHQQNIPLQAVATSTTPPIRYSYWGNRGYNSQVNPVSGQSVMWNLNADSVGSLQYVISAATGPDSLCRTYDTVNVLVRPLPVVTLTPNHYELCDRDTLVLTAAGANTYSWDTTQTFSQSHTQTMIPAVGTHDFLLYGDDIYGCRNHDTTQIVVYGYPNTQLVSNYYDICNGNTVALTAMGAQHYSWDNGSSWHNAQPATGIDTMTRILYDSITLYVDGYNLSPLCQVRDSVRIRVYSYPAMSWVADTNEICLGDTVRLTASGGVEYSFDNGATWTSDSTINYVPSTPTTHTYGVIGRSEGPGCPTPMNLSVLVHPLPNLQLSVSNSAFCVDTVITITATGGERYRLYEDTNTSLPDYGTQWQWTRQPDSSTTYHVDCLTHFNCFATIAHPVIVWTGRFQLFCEDTIVCEHGTVAVSAQGMEQYYWNGSTIPDTHNVYIFTVDTSSDFTVYGDDSHGCHGQETLHVDVYPNPHLQLSADTLGTCVGGTVDIFASGAGEYIYHWDDGSITTTDSSHTALVMDTTWYTVTGIEGNLRCHTTDSIQIIAYPLPPVQLVGDQRDICDRDTLHLTATGADRYAWDTTLNFQLSNLNYDVPVADSIYLVWGEEDTYHCRNYDTTMVHWFGHPAVSLTAGRTKICHGDSVMLTFGNAPFYDFDHSGILTTANTVIVQPDTTTTYHLYADLRNPRFCGSDTTLTIEVYPIPDVQISASDTELCYGDTVTLTGTGAAYYAWLDDTNHLVPDTFRLPLFHSTTLHLSGTIPNRLCYNNDSIHVTVYDPRVRLNPQAWEICNGGSLVISATGSDRYRWSDDSDFTDSTSHTYTFSGSGSVSTQSFVHVTGETANHLCQADTTISIVVYPGPHIRLTIEDHDSIGIRLWEVCAGDSVTFFASGGYFYQFPGQTTAARPVRHRYHPQSVGPDTSVYVLYGENFNHQCSGYDSLTIIVNPLPDVSLASSRLLVCEGDSVILSASGATQYSWFGPGNYGTDTSRAIVVDSTVQFLLWGRDNKLCRNFDTLTVSAFPFPQVHLSASADTICQGFSTTVTATGATAYAWDSTLTFSQSNTQTFTPLHDTVIYVWGNNFNGLCATLDSIRITVLPLPTVQIVADAGTICWGDTAHLTATCSESTWSWDNGPYVSTGLDVAPLDSTWYHITTRAANGCYAYDSFLVEVRPFYHVHLHGDTNVCSGDSLSFSATGSDSYAWGTTTAFTQSSTHTFTFLYNTDTNINIVVRGTPRDSICRSADTLTVHVYQIPELYVDPETTTVCLGDSVILSASGGIGPYRCEQFLWMDETEFGLHNGYHVYRPQTSISYVVTGSRLGGVCPVTDTIEITVIDTPQVAFAGPVDICLGDSVRLTASGGERYAWEGGEFTTSGYFHHLPDTLGTFTYNVVSRVHALNCAGHGSIDVHVHPVPVLQLVADDSVLCYGESATITASGAYQYLWPSTYTFTQSNNHTFTPAQTTTYTVYATDSMMLCSDTQSLTILVNPLPTILLSPDTTEFCLGGSLTLTASGGESYAWTPTGTFTQSNTHTFIPSADTVVNVWGIDSNGCLNRDSVYINLHTPFQSYQSNDHHVIVHRYPTVGAAINHSMICVGDDVVLTASGAQYYRWLDMGGSTTNPLSDTPDSSRTYTVEGRMSYGCPDTATVSVQVFLYPPVSLQISDTQICVGDTILLTASGAPRYSWDGTQTFTQSDTHTFIPPVGEHTYTVVGATDNLLCSSTDTVQVTVYPYPDMTLHGAVRWCEGSEVILTVGNPADTLRWTSTPADPSLVGQEHSDTLRLHPSVSTLYHLQGKSAICAVEMEHAVEIVPYPHLQLNTSTDRICIGDTVLFTATGGELYSWDGLGNQWTATDSHTYRPRETGFFPVLATTYDTLCTVSDSLFVFVDTVPVITITGSDSGCIGRTVTLEAHSEVPVFWSSEPADPSLDTQMSMFTIVVSPTTDIRYTVTGYSGLCMASASHLVTTGIIPLAKGVATPNHVRRGEADIELINKSINAEGYFWLFPDSIPRYGNHYHYQIPPSWLLDTFPIQLVAYLGGCFDTADIFVTLYIDEVWTANVFTPNEETNNRFYVPNINKTNFYVEIFNRQGLLVYESDDPDDGWDGRSKGELCPQATYVYRVRTSPKGSKVTNYKYGTVTLLR